jgi:hypothetical protein
VQVAAQEEAEAEAQEEAEAEAEEEAEAEAEEEAEAEAAAPRRPLEFHLCSRSCRDGRLPSGRPCLAADSRSGTTSWCGRT